jgi:hypothetical protein
LIVDLVLLEVELEVKGIMMHIYCGEKLWWMPGLLPCQQMVADSSRRGVDRAAAITALRVCSYLESPENTLGA